MTTKTHRPEQDWHYDLTRASVTQNKSVQRTGIPVAQVGECAELVGVDLRTKGEVRMFPGFKAINMLGVGESDDPATTYTFASPARTDDIYKVVPVSVRIGAEFNIHGFVWFEDDTAAKQIRAWWQWRDTIGVADEDAVATPTEDVDRLSLLTTANYVDGERPSVSVTPQGRLLYVWVKGQPPVLWYTKRKPVSGGGSSSSSSVSGGVGPGDFVSVIESDTGPGPRPAAPAVTLDFLSWPNIRNGGNPIPIVEFPFYDPTTDAWDPTQVIDWAPEDILDPGAYTFAYRLRDSQTGRVSPISEVAAVYPRDFEERVPFQRSWVDPGGTGVAVWDLEYRSVPVPQRPSFVASNLDNTKWDEIEILRSVGSIGVGNITATTVLRRDSRRDLPEPLGGSSSSVSGGVSFPSTGEFVDFINDQSLVLQPQYRDAALFDEEPPNAGAVALYRGSAYASDVSAPLQELAFENVEEFRYSSLSESSIELFPVDNRYVSKLNPAQPIIGWQELGDTLIGFSPVSLFEVTISDVFAVFREMHQNKGLVGPDAKCSYASSVLYVSREGMKELATNGALVSINAFNTKIREDWAGKLTRVSMAVDEQTSCIYTLNPETEEALCLWTETRLSSELHRLPFEFVAEGVDPLDVRGGRRALFFTKRGVVAKTDAARSQVTNAVAHGVAAGQIFRRLWDTLTPASLRMADNLDPVNSPHPHPFLEDIFSVVTIPGDLRFLVDAVLYVDTGDETGKWMRVTAVDESAETVTIDTRDVVVANIASGDRVLVNPIQMRCLFWPMPVGDSGGLTHTRERSLHSLGVTFGRASGPGLSYEGNTSNWRAFVEQGLDRAEIAEGRPPLRSGEVGIRVNPAVVHAPLGGPGTGGNLGVRGNVLVPGIEVVSCDVDCSLLAITLDGTVGSTNYD